MRIEAEATLAADVPLVLAEAHRAMVTGDGLVLSACAEVPVGDGVPAAGAQRSEPEPDRTVGVRSTTWWDREHLVEVVEGGAFDVEHVETGPVDRTGRARLTVRATRRRGLPDHVGAGMRLLVCGINPSEHAADAGVGYVTASNRFWPAMLAAALTDVDRDPAHLLRRHRIGMTDLVKRPTPRASDLVPADYRPALDRLERLCTWLEPEVLVVVGVGAWRIAAGDRRAEVGWQAHPVGPTPVYVMPSTSGLNARVPLTSLVDHLRTAAAGRPRRRRGSTGSAGSVGSR